MYRITHTHMILERLDSTYNNALDTIYIPLAVMWSIRKGAVGTLLKRWKADDKVLDYSNKWPGLLFPPPSPQDQENDSPKREENIVSGFTIARDTAKLVGHFYMLLQHISRAIAVELEENYRCYVDFLALHDWIQSNQSYWRLLVQSISG